MDLLEKKYGNGGTQDPIPASPSVADLATSQIVALLERVEFGPYGQMVAFESAVKELVRRSLTGFINHPATPATEATQWLAKNFRKDDRDRLFIGWLRKIVELPEDYGFGQLRRLFPQSAAVRFAETEPVTGFPEQWDYLPAIPASRKEVRFSGKIFRLPSGEVVPVAKIPGGGYYRIREDGRTDLFLKRGSPQLGDCGWLWVLINPQRQPYDAVEAALDPLQNYRAMREIFTPIFGRIARAHARARGWKIEEELYSLGVCKCICGPEFGQEG